MIVFAILGLMIGLLFMFVRQKLSALESKVNLLTDTVQTMAGLNRLSYEADSSESEEDEDEESEEEEESEDEDEVKDPEIVDVSEPEVINLTWDVNPISLEPEPEPEVKTITLEKRVVSDDNVDYESLTLKELKDKVTDLGGPKLRTKKELLDFLKNKI
jgi:hypothetical protein